ncbi:hypothetical protein [Streptomyces lunaelactis]|uniref:hypothetical protein n=1 Tax=Streptomyces lunaelactis TaxID=1535768 RepID=UPI0035A08AE0
MFGGAGNRRLGRLLAQGCAVFMTAVALTLAGPGAQDARAASSAPCAGRLQKTVKFAGGEVRVYKSGHYACAVTLARKPGARRAMSVSLQARGGRAAVDKGAFTRQAGPVTVHALNRCVRATGAISGTARSTGWILC